MSGAWLHGRLFPQKCDLWDERRAAVVERIQPGSAGAVKLPARGSFAAFRSSVHLRDEARYELIRDGEPTHLARVQWADWAPGGELVVATVDGHLQVRVGGSLDPAFDVDLVATSLIRLLPRRRAPGGEPSAIEGFYRRRTS